MSTVLAALMVLAAYAAFATVVVLGMQAIMGALLAVWPL